MPLSFAGRRAERQMLLLFIMLGLVLVLMHEAAKPALWAKFLSRLTGQHVPLADAVAIDTRLPDDDHADDPPGTFRSRRPIDVDPPLTDATAELPETLDPSWFQTVEDDRALHAAERDVVYHVLDLVRATGGNQRALAALPQADFVQLFGQSTVYRGRQVRLEGTVRGVYLKAAAANRYGIDQTHELWLQPHDSPTSVIMLVAVALPNGFPVGDAVNEVVTVSGYFFKRCAYRAQDGLRTAPMVIVRSIEWHQRLTPPRDTFNGMAIASIFGLAICCAAICAGLVLRESKRRRRPHVGPFTDLRLVEAGEILLDDEASPVPPSASGLGDAVADGHVVDERQPGRLEAANDDISGREKS